MSVHEADTASPSALPVPLDPPLPPGEMLGKYQLLKLLGEGAMGQVYLAQHTLLGRQMALKVLRAEYASNVELVARFFQEARAANQINHDHIVQVFDFVQEAPGADKPGCVYCVMESLSGESLADRVARGSMPVADVLRLGVQVCSALDAAHRAGVIHRDIKPDNIFLTKREGELFAKVLDFGVAKLNHALDHLDLVPSTVQGTIIGTPAYMSPEQASGAELDGRTDLYSLGVVLFEALTGRPPFRATTLGSLLVEVITREPPPLPPRTPEGELIPRTLASLVRRCLAKDPDQRPGTMTELATALTHIGAIEVQGPRRTALAHWALGGALAAGVLAASGLWLGASSSETTSAAPEHLTPPRMDALPASTLALAQKTSLAPLDRGVAGPAPSCGWGQAEPSPILSPHLPAPKPTPTHPAINHRKRKVIDHDSVIDPFSS